MISPRNSEHFDSVFATSAGKKTREHHPIIAVVATSARRSRARKESPQDVGIIHIIGRPLLRRSASFQRVQRRAGRPTPACLLFLHE